MEHDNEKLDAMLERLMRDEALESPSVNFTDKVMDKVYAIETSTVTAYKPLISKRVWLLIVLSFTFLVAFVMLNNGSADGQWLSSFELPRPEFTLFDNINFQLSGTFKYAVLFLAIMIGVQMTVIKSYFGRRLTY
ncbi:hypothetical protein [Winogradskyella aurantiaca]|uniref:hypothetical protein n=1 Tax=Winogradskyella aurantiaca TaxID=2219558 RepID=UPI000E1DAD05|nr:hypothetical protein [Winogradskyella aurantiaca]